MSTFEHEMEKGNFVCSECQKCNKLVWPPNDFCNTCFGKVRWRPVSKMARVIEFSRRENVIFCVAEFENSIRVMGSVESASGQITLGEKIKLVKCEFNGKEKFIFQTERSEKP